MEWYGRSGDWFLRWPHWDPWSSLADGESLPDYKPDRIETVDDGEGGERQIGYLRAFEMSYIFEYCASHWRDTEGVQFVDCDIIADPQRWGE